jgi:DNA-directed RNA polymerase specialized sigma24 family protein
MSDTTNSAEGDFFSIVLCCIEGSRSIDEILGHKTFRDQLNEFVKSRRFDIFRGKYDRDDLSQDICLILWKMEPKLRIPGNVLTEDEFFDWLFVLVRNRYFSVIRQHIAQKRDGLRGDTPIKENQIPARKVDFEGQVFLSQFLKFTERYPEEWQWAVDLWLEDYSYRDIQEVLNSRGIPCTYGTIRNWVIAIVGDFKKSLESPVPKKMPTQLPRWLAS